jgi:hypothetical protein
MGLSGDDILDSHLSGFHSHASTIGCWWVMHSTYARLLLHGLPQEGLYASNKHILAQQASIALLLEFVWVSSFFLLCSWLLRLWSMDVHAYLLECTQLVSLQFARTVFADLLVTILVQIIIVALCTTYDILCSLGATEVASKLCILLGCRTNPWT